MGSMKMARISVGLIAALMTTLVVVGFSTEGPRAAGGQDLLLEDGVFTGPQASRGERVYRRTCESCHAPNLEGSEEGPTLIGEEFLGGWDGEILAELMILTLDTMPEEDPGGLSEEEYTDVMAFILKENGYPEGDELTMDLMEEILIELED